MSSCPLLAPSSTAPTNLCNPQAIHNHTTILLQSQNPIAMEVRWAGVYRTRAGGHGPNILPFERPAIPAITNDGATQSAQSQRNPDFNSRLHHTSSTIGQKRHPPPSRPHKTIPLLPAQPQHNLGNPKSGCNSHAIQKSPRNQ